MKKIVGRLLRVFLGFYVNRKKRNHISYRSVSLEAEIGDYVTILGGTSVDKNSTIGSYTYIGKNCMVTKANIARFVSIGDNVSIGVGSHDYSKISTSAFFYDNPYDELTEKDCIVESDVWIGVDSIVLRGIKVGFGAVIGANSVVTKDVPPFAVVVGSPAKIITYRFSLEQQRRITSSLWWQKELVDAKVIINDMVNSDRDGLN